MKLGVVVITSESGLTRTPRTQMQRYLIYQLKKKISSTRTCRLNSDIASMKVSTRTSRRSSFYSKLVYSLFRDSRRKRFSTLKR